MMAATKTEVRTITAELLTREAFAPFGDVLSTDGITALKEGSNFYSEGKSNLYRPSVLESDRPVEYLLYESGPRPMRVRFLERHVELTQTFIPLGGKPFVMVVAKPDAAEDENGIPLVEEVHAFIVPGTAGANIRRGTWHEPPFPLAGRMSFVITSHQELTQGLQSQLNEKQEVAQLDVEKRNITERSGYELRVQLP
jgi:ureidoglycolate lyase